MKGIRTAGIGDPTVGQVAALAGGSIGLVLVILQAYVLKFMVP